MPTNASVIFEGDGGMLFQGGISRDTIAGVASGGGDGGGADGVEWDANTARMNLLSGSAVIDYIQFYAFDA